MFFEMSYYTTGPVSLAPSHQQPSPRCSTCLSLLQRYALSPVDQECSAQRERPATPPTAVQDFLLIPPPAHVGFLQEGDPVRAKFCCVAVSEFRATNHSPAKRLLERQPIFKTNILDLWVAPGVVDGLNEDVDERGIKGRVWMSAQILSHDIHPCWCGSPGRGATAQSQAPSRKLGPPMTRLNRLKEEHVLNSAQKDLDCAWSLEEVGSRRGYGRLFLVTVGQNQHLCVPYRSDAT